MVKMAILPMKKRFFFSWINVDGGLPVYLCSVQDVGARHVRYYCIIIYICVYTYIYIYMYTYLYYALWHAVAHGIPTFGP
jgi:hypothetical protein